MHVEPPPRDPTYVPGRERPFEPAPFMDAQPHAVRMGPGDGSRTIQDRWNRVPPPRSDHRVGNVGNTRNTGDGGGRQRRESKRRKVSSSSAPFDNLKDIFDNIRSKKEKANNSAGREHRSSSAEEDAEGFKYGDFEVFPSNAAADEDGSRKNGRRQEVVEVEIIDAETLEEGGDVNVPRRPPPSRSPFSEAWKGGPEAAAPSSHLANGVDSGSGRFADAGTFRAARRARDLLANDPEVRAVVARAHADPRLREALRRCADDPRSFGRYLEDADGIGPVLKELRDCIS